MLTKIITALGGIALLETCSQSALKYACVHPSMRYIGLLGPIGYTIICYILYRLYDFEGMAIINSLWNIITSITVALTGVLIFGEALKGSDILGLCFVLLGSFFLSLDDLGIV